MRFLIQRVTSAKVDVDGKTVGSIDHGFLVFIGVCNTDTKEIADGMVKKLAYIRRRRECQRGDMRDSIKQLFVIAFYRIEADQQDVLLTQCGAYRGADAQAGFPPGCSVINLKHTQLLFDTEKNHC